MSLRAPGGGRVVRPAAGRAKGDSTMRFHTLDLALAAQQAIVPLVHRVQRHDRRAARYPKGCKLAQQLKDATNSFVLNLGEGAYSDPGTGTWIACSLPFGNSPTEHDRHGVLAEGDARHRTRRHRGHGRRARRATPPPAGAASGVAASQASAPTRSLTTSRHGRPGPDHRPRWPRRGASAAVTAAAAGAATDPDTVTEAGRRNSRRRTPISAGRRLGRG